MLPAVGSEFDFGNASFGHPRGSDFPGCVPCVCACVRVFLSHRRLRLLGQALVELQTFEVAHLSIGDAHRRVVTRFAHKC